MSFNHTKPVKVPYRKGDYYQFMDIIKLIEKAKLYDISVGLSNKTPVFPAQPKFQLDYIKEIEKGDRVNLSKFLMSSHTGTHIDAPFHFINDGNKIDKVKLKSVIGYAKVFKINASKIDLNELKNLNIVKNDIILFKTSNSELWGKEDFVYKYVFITPKAAEYLANKGIRAVGVDYMIPELFGDFERPVHYILLGKDIVIIEGLDLTNVTEGNYLLICLPLKILGNDGAPARAVLLEI